MITSEKPDVLDWQNPNSKWHAHPTNHRLRPGGPEYETRYKWVRDQIGPFSKVLDVGCNCGQLAINLARDLGCEVWGADIVSDFVHNCHTCREKDLLGPTFCLDFSRADRELMVANSLASGDFDYVTALEVIEHPIYLRGFRDNVLRALSRPGGRLIITTPHPDNPWHGWQGIKRLPWHVRMWTPSRLERVFGKPETLDVIYDHDGSPGHLAAVFRWDGWDHPDDDPVEDMRSFLKEIGDTFARLKRDWLSKEKAK